MLYDKKWDKEVEAPVELEPWRQALLDAAGLIRNRGWCRNSYETLDGRLCLVGALRLSRTGAWPLAADKIASFLGGNPIYWNDAVGRSKEEVIAVLEAAAKAP